MIEEIIAQCIMVACWNTAREHEPHGCGWWICGQQAHDQLYHFYICPHVERPPGPDETGDPLRWN